MMPAIIGRIDDETAHPMMVTIADRMGRVHRPGGSPLSNPQTVQRMASGTKMARMLPLASSALCHDAGEALGLSLPLQ